MSDVVSATSSQRIRHVQWLTLPAHELTLDTSSVVREDGDLVAGPVACGQRPGDPEFVLEQLS